MTLTLSNDFKNFNINHVTTSLTIHRVKLFSKDTIKYKTGNISKVKKGY